MKSLPIIEYFNIFKDVTPADIDAFIENSQMPGYEATTVNRRLVVSRTFYCFLSLISIYFRSNLVIPKGH